MDAISETMSISEIEIACAEPGPSKTRKKERRGKGKHSNSLYSNIPCWNFPIVHSV